MRKLILVTLFIAAAFGIAAAQQDASTSHADNTPNMGRAPAAINGIGRLDARIFDESGNPVQGAYVKLESNRTDGYFCEAWNYSSDHGVAVLPPIHMGTLKLLVKAKGYETQKIDVAASSLGEPVRVTLKKKS